MRQVVQGVLPRLLIVSISSWFDYQYILFAFDGVGWIGIENEKTPGHIGLGPGSVLERSSNILLFWLRCNGFEIFAKSPYGLVVAFDIRHRVGDFSSKLREGSINPRKGGVSNNIPRGELFHIFYPSCYCLLANQSAEPTVGTF